MSLIPFRTSGAAVFAGLALVAASVFPAGNSGARGADGSFGAESGVAAARRAAPGPDRPKLSDRALRLESLRQQADFMGVPAERAFHLPVESTTAAPFTYNVLVVLVEFSDVRADRDAHPPAFYQHRFFDGAPGSPSLSDYYRANSGGRFQVRGLVTNWIRVDSTYASYSEIDPAGYPHNVQRLVEDAVAKIGGQYRWQDFDNDKDGLVDGLFVIHAGPGADETAILDDTGTHILAHQFRTSHEVPVSGAKVFDYAAADESARLGIVAHEFGHLLGLIDLYPNSAYAGSDGPFGLGDWSLMATGALLDGASAPSNLDAWSRAKVGFVTPVRIDATPGQVVLFDPGDDTVLRLPGAEGDLEYFLVEDRYQEGFDSALPGRGLLVYHVDDAVQNNSTPTHPRVALLQADGFGNLDRWDGNRGDIGDPFPNALSSSPRDDLTDNSIPDTRTWSGAPSNVALYNIHRNLTGYQAEAVIEKPPAPHLVDFRIREAEGNGNGRVERGELASVDVTVENSGGPVTADDLSMGFAPDESIYFDVVDLIEGSLSIGNIGQGETRTLPDAFRFRFRAEAPDSAGIYLFHAFFTCSACVANFEETDVMVPLGNTAPLADNFESGAAGWTHTALRAGMTDPWNLSTQSFHSAGHSFMLGAAGRTYESGLDAVLVSPVFQIPQRARLSFWHSIDAESLATGRAWDGGVVEISVAGSSWRELVPEGGYPFRLESGSGNPLFERRAFSGHSAFRRETFDLSGLAGAAARIRFRFASDSFSEPGQVQRGWSIDDVVVSGGSPEIAASATLTDSGVEVRWSANPGSASLTGFNVFRREDFETAAPVRVARLDASGGPAYSAFDEPPPGRFIYEIEAVEAEGAGVRVSAPLIVVPDRGATPRLARPFPNPYRVSGAPATFDFFVPQSAADNRVVLDVIDVAGRLVRRLVDGPAVAGNTRVQWTGEIDSGRIHSGIYYVRLSIGGAQTVQRLVVIS